MRLFNVPKISMQATLVHVASTNKSYRLRQNFEVRPRFHRCRSQEPSHENKMPKEVEPSLNERQFFAKALQEDIRLDGRSFDQFRALELEFGDEYGVADVRLGNTRYIIPWGYSLHS